MSELIHWGKQWLHLSCEETRALLMQNAAVTQDYILAKYQSHRNAGHNVVGVVFIEPKFSECERVKRGRTYVKASGIIAIGVKKIALFLSITR
jgi:hypothetical protein